MKFRNNKKGMAMLLVMTSVVILSLIIVELNYNTRISSTIASNYRDETVAYYLARSSINVAMLRIGIANKAKSFKSGGFTMPPEVVSMIITLPFVFPPPIQLLTTSGKADDADLGVKDMLEQIKTDTNIASVGYFDHNITSMDTTMNINFIALGENSITGFKEQMKNYYSAKVQRDPSFAHRCPIEKFERVINNVIDWIDQDTTSRNGGDENAAYSRKDPLYRTRNYFIPTLNELHLVDEMDDELFDFLSPMISVFSSGAINVNHATMDMWKSIDSRLSDDEIKAIMEKIQTEGDFSSKADLTSWIGKNTRIPAGDFNPLSIPLSYSDDTFKIIATGHSGRVSKKITCFVSDSYKQLLLTGQWQNGTSGTSGSTGSTGTTGVTTNRSEIIFWEM